MSAPRVRQCKRDGCREDAVLYGKQYCPTHTAERVARQRRSAAMRATLPNCVCCGEHLTLAAHTNGYDTCTECRQAQELRDAEHAKVAAFDDAETVDDLKQWMRQYLLGDN